MKMKKFFVSLMLIVSCLCFVSCKDGGQNAENSQTTGQKQEPTVQVSISNETRYEGDLLKNIELILAGGSTNGTVKWENENYSLVVGDNSCVWVFTPDDTATYKSKTGTITISARNKLLIPEVENVQVKTGTVIYAESKLELIKDSLECSASFGGEPIEGTITWENKNYELVAGKNTCKWVFTPAEANVYRNVSGEIEVTTNAVQTVERVEIKSAKTSGYKAYDQFDFAGIVAELVYNAGKVERIELNSKNCGVGYPDYNNSESNCFHQGDETVVIKYSSCPDVELEIDKVDYYRVALPQFKDKLVYDGYSQQFRVSSENLSDIKYYTVEDKTGLNAGDYYLQVTLDSSYLDNCKWEGSEEQTVSIKCVILKAELKVTENNYVGIYDGQPHSASVSCSIATKICYSMSEDFSAENEELIQFTNAGEYVVYYLAKGSDNFNDKQGTISVNISKQTPVMSLKNAYSLNTNDVVNYPTTFVTVSDANDEKLDLDQKLRFTYYQTYSQEDTNLSVLTSAKDGAQTTGGAPSVAKSTAYVVLVEYLGDDLNFAPTSEITTLFIDSSDVKFYGHFAFVNNAEYYEKQLADGDNIIDIKFPLSTGKIVQYVEFKRLEKNKFGVIEIIASYKLDYSAGKENAGRLIWVSNYYYLELEDGERCRVELENESLKLSYTENLTLEKWEIPNYLGTYQAKTVSDEVYNNADYDKAKNTSQYTNIRIYNEFGIIKFTIDGNVQFIKSILNEESSAGGHFVWSGTISTKVDVLGTIDSPRALIFNCTITEKNGVATESSSVSFILSWEIARESLDNPIIDSITMSQDSIEAGYLDLVTSYERVEA